MDGDDDDDEGPDNNKTGKNEKECNKVYFRHIST